MKKIVLYSLMTVSAALFFSCNNEKTATPQRNFVLSTDSAGVVMLPIAYIDVDTLLLNYGFAKEMNENVLHKQEEAKLTLSQRESAMENEMRTAQGKLEAEMKDFQEKVQRQVFQTEERAQSEYARLAKQEQALQAKAQSFAQELQTLNQKLTQEMLAEQQKINAQLKDSLNAVLAVYNADKQYHLIVSNDAMSNTVLYADKQYNITKDVLNLLNSRYIK
ncbi:MAG: OmpH family outer membrane protein [Prevotellaceae bacterium]|jgi:outer membrane protein|nr:OmpH family outer membrane protein [Prevotellaceae bacterium]